MTIPSSVDEIVDKQLYLGNLSAALSSDLRKQLGITHILSVCPDFPSTPGLENHLAIAVDDTEYDDILIHLPDACAFIKRAIDQDGGRLLVHCFMGISRSATVLSAFLMQSRKITPAQALQLIRERRPCVQPNYGFLKQLDVFAQCDYHPTTDNPTYIAWKRRQEQNVFLFLNKMVDTISIIPDRLFLSSDLPEDVEQFESLLFELGITHLLSIAPSAAVPNTQRLVQHRHFSDTEQHRGAVLLILPEVCKFIQESLSKQGTVLVYSEKESKAVLATFAYTMQSQGLPPEQVYSQINEALPLFNRTSNFTEQLELFNTCSYTPTKDHLLVQKWLRTSLPSDWTSSEGLRRE